MSGHAGEGSPAPGVLADDVGWVNHMDSSQDQLLHTQLQQLGLESVDDAPAPYQNLLGDAVPAAAPWMVQNVSPPYPGGSGGNGAPQFADAASPRIPTQPWGAPSLMLHRRGGSDLNPAFRFPSSRPTFHADDMEQQRQAIQQQIDQLQQQQQLLRQQQQLLQFPLMDPTHRRIHSQSAAFDATPGAPVWGSHAGGGGMRSAPSMRPTPGFAFPPSRASDAPARSSEPRRPSLPPRFAPADVGAVARVPHGGRWPAQPV